jgi:hypothetical protein
MKKLTTKQSIFYIFIFLSGIVYQPVWVYENFWSKANFYDSLPFDFPYFGFIFIYSTLATYFCFLCVKIAKKHL